jgi:hypothetical protein
MEIEKLVKTAIHSYSAVTPANDLVARVLFRVERARVQRARLEAMFFGVGSVVAFGTVLSLIVSLHRALITSGFYAYVSLIFSGDSAVYTFWNELAYALAESVPSVALGMMLVVSMAFVWMFGEMVNRVPTAYVRAVSR